MGKFEAIGDAEMENVDGGNPVVVAVVLLAVRYVQTNPRVVVEAVAAAGRAATTAIAIGYAAVNVAKGIWDTVTAHP